MMNRRTFLKLSAGALVLAAAGSLTGCGDTPVDPTSATVSMGDGRVRFTCAVPRTAGGGFNQSSGSYNKITYQTQFTIENRSRKTVTLLPENIVCIFKDDQDRSDTTMTFKSNSLTAAPGETAVYTGAFGNRSFYLETENGMEELFNTGTYELRVTYGGQTAFFFYNGKTVTGSVK